MTEPAIAASWATQPAFYHAPHPGQMVPKPYQLAGVEYIIARNHGLLGDEMGLGKTAQAIMTGNAIGAKRTLVVCPASLRLNWEREIWMWSTVENVSTYPILKAKDGVSTEAHYVIISYDLLRNAGILAALMDLRWDHLILDEAHAIKDVKGNARTKVICAPDLLPSVVGRITMASGTILPNQPSEAYNAIRLLNWDAIDRASLQDFRETYYAMGGGMVRSPVFDPKIGATVSKVHWSDEVRNVPTNLADLQYRMRKHIMVRRLKQDVLKDLPTAKWRPFPLVMTSGIKTALSHPGWKTAEKLYDMDALNTSIPIDGEIATARRLLGEAKAPAVAEYIEEMLREGADKLVVAAWHSSVLELLRRRLGKYGLAYMDGSTSAKARQTAVDAFQTDPSLRVILGQMQVIGTGWTLTVAQDCILAEPDWVPGNNDQMLARIHRMGQAGAYVTGHIPVVPGTLDERILGTAVNKGRNIFVALDKRQ